MEDVSKKDGQPEDNSHRISNAEEDGRNKEWSDRARVNLEEVPDGTHTNIERDFEPEKPEEENKKEVPPAY